MSASCRAARRQPESSPRARLAVFVTALIVCLVISPATRGGEVNLVQNGDFSAGLAGWTQGGNADVGTLTHKHCLPAQEGNPFLYINAYWGLDGWVEQNLTLPDAPTTLVFRTWGHLDPVTASVRILDQLGVEHVLDTFTPPITEWSEDANNPSKPLLCTGNGPVQKSYSLLPYKGQSITLRFRGTSNGTNGTFADFDDVEIMAPASQLAASLEVDPTEVEIDDTFTVTLTVTNDGEDTLTGVAPATGGMGGTGAATLVSGPTPASVASLAPDASAAFVYTAKATGEGNLTLTASATGRNGMNQQVTSNTAQSAEIRIGPFIKLVRAGSPGAKGGQIVPGGKITIRAEFEKIGKVPMTISLDSDIPLYTGLESATIPADQTGSVAVDLPVRIADETNDEIMANVMDADQGPGSISLDARLSIKADYTVKETPRSRTFQESLRKADDSVWSITYPDYSLVTGEPPTSEPTELPYYKNGNVVHWEKKPIYPVYLKDPVVRKWMLKAVRYTAADNLTPEEPREAAASIAQFLVDKLPFKWTGTGNEIGVWARQLEAGQAHGPTACVNFAFYLGAATRVVGLRSREMNNAMKYLVGWAQHATNQVWFDGQWNWFDCALGMKFNGGKPIRDYPQAYFTRVKYGSVLPYGRIRTWYAIDDHGYNFVLGNDDGTSGELKDHEKWRFYAYHEKKDLVASGDPQSSAMKESVINIMLHSPVTTLYTDALGRRLGAAGTLTEADFLSIGSENPLSGGGSVWDIPGGVYIAPGMYQQFGVTEALAGVQVDEQLIIPAGEFGGPFSLKLTGTGNGPYKVTIQHVTESSSTDLYAWEGEITAGETVQLDLEGDASGETPTVQAPPLFVPQVGPPCAGTALVAVGGVLAPLYAVGWLGRRLRLRK